MSFARYARRRIWDILLCVMAASALSYTCGSAFYATQAYQAVPALYIAPCFVLMLALFSAAYNTRSAIAGTVLLVIAFIVAFVACARANPGASVFDDVEGNPVLLLVITVLMSLLVFFASRKKPTALLLIVIGVLLCAVIEHLYWYGHVVPFLAFFVATIVLFVYKNYQANLSKSDSSELVFGMVSATGCVLALASAGLAALAFFAVVAPLDPPYLAVKLITEHYRLEEVEVEGIADQVSIENDQVFSMQTNDQKKTANNDTDSGAQETQNMDDSQLQGDDPLPNAGASTGLDDGQNSSNDWLGLLDPPWKLVLWTALVALLIVAVIAGRKLMRRRRLNAMAALPHDERVRAFYLFFLKCFEKIGIPHPTMLTLQEYAQNFETTFNGFERGMVGASFAAMTDIYVKTVYGKVAPSEDECDVFMRYYQAFHANARQFVGTLKYPLLFFRI